MAGLGERDEENVQEEFDEEDIECYALEDIQDRFFEPWENSDLVLVVKERKIHVHRLILTIASPVFKQMLNGNFVERNLAEIPLPGKDAYEFISFLRQLYPHYKDKLNVYNCDFLYELPDEYQVESLKQSCVEVLKAAKPTRDNVFIILKAAKLLKDDEVYKKCKNIAKEMTVKDIIYLNECQNLEQDEMLSLMIAKAKRLEKCLKNVLPEFVGVLDLALFFWLKKGEESYPLTPCPAHYLHGKAAKGATIKERVACKACEMMYKQMQYQLMIEEGYGDIGYTYSDSGVYFNDIITSLKEMYNLSHSDVTSSTQ